MNHEERAEILNRHVAQLREHFDAVEIVACRSDSDTAQCATRFESGGGGFYERFGMMRAWVIRQEEIERVHAREEVESED